MHSEYYRQFMKQSQAEGREKADGFDKQALRRLSGEERVSAETHLMELARNGDTTAIDALEVYDSGQVRDALNSILATAPCPSRFHSETAFVLWKLTQDSEYQEALLKDLDDPIATFRATAINHIAETGKSDAAVKALVKVLKEDPDKTCCGAAARTLLHFAGVWPDLDGRPVELQDIVKGLWHDDRKKRQPTVMKVLARIAG